MFSFFRAQRPDGLGVKGRLLAPCPSSPNAVSSQAGDAAHRVEPFPFNGDATEVMGDLQALVEGMAGAAIIECEGPYLYAEFTTPLLGFVDDFELFADAECGLVHIRSASRMGHSDLGTNRRRVEALRRRINQSAG